MEEAEADIPHLLAEAAGARYASEPAVTHRMPATRAHASADAPRRPVLRTVGVIVAALLFAALLNADHLVDRAGKKPFGGGRDFWLGVWAPFQDVSDATYLNRPRLWLDELLGRELATAPRDSPAAPAASQNAAPSVSGPASEEAPANGATPVEPGASAAPPPVQTPTAAPAPRLRVPATDSPLKLWVGGDSMAVQFGGSLGRLASGTGLLTPTLDSRSSSGLTRPDFYDWPAHLAEVAEKQQPDVMVIMFGANDAQGIRTPDGKVFQPLTDGWRAEYRRRVAGTMDRVAGEHRLVIWMGQPVMEADGYSARMADIDTIYREEAARREGFVYFDSWSLFVDSAGKYNAFLPDANGATQNMRQADGVHLTLAGADRLASAVLRALNEETTVLP